ncbi:hypothetical protein [Mythimna sequax nucleopolyhedrovirus]|nr:hypothetical protein [Mythimna sequax nucleopolyhedrovirus]
MTSILAKPESVEVGFEKICFSKAKFDLIYFTKLDLMTSILTEPRLFRVGF